MRKSKYHKVNKQILVKYKTECCICGETSKCCLEFHHLYNKQYNISQSVKYLSTKLFINELYKCICICANCHRKLHANLLRKNNSELFKYKINIE